MSDFSDFIHNSSPEEKKKLYLEVLKEATNDQRKIMNTPTYEEAKEAKEVLIKYLKSQNIDYRSFDDMKNNKYIVAYLALTQEYFLD